MKNIELLTIDAFVLYLEPIETREHPKFKNAIELCSRHIIPQLFGRAYLQAMGCPEEYLEESYDKLQYYFLGRLYKEENFDDETLYRDCNYNFIFLGGFEQRLYERRGVAIDYDISEVNDFGEPLSDNIKIYMLSYVKDYIDDFNRKLTAFHIWAKESKECPLRLPMIPWSRIETK